MSIFAATTVLVSIIGAAAELPSQTPNQADWKAWRFLMGEWVGEGGGGPGQGSGTFTFALDLQGRVLIRKNHADYPATKDRPASSHDDLMVIYQDAGKATRAIFFDNEGHVINYSVEFSASGDQVVFLSDQIPDVPRFRLTYSKAPAGKLTILFEIAPPGKPDAFSAYITATARRK